VKGRGNHRGREGGGGGVRGGRGANEKLDKYDGQVHTRDINRWQQKVMHVRHLCRRGRERFAWCSHLRRAISLAAQKFMARASRDSVRRYAVGDATVVHGVKRGVEKAPLIGRATGRHRRITRRGEGGGPALRGLAYVSKVCTIIWTAWLWYSDRAKSASVSSKLDALSWRMAPRRRSLKSIATLAKPVCQPTRFGEETTPEQDEDTNTKRSPPKSGAYHTVAEAMQAKSSGGRRGGHVGRKLSRSARQRKSD